MMLSSGAIPNRDRLLFSPPPEVRELRNDNTSTFFMGDERIAEIVWHEGVPVQTRRYRDGNPCGWWLEHHDDGSVSFAEPHEGGLVHGVTYQWALDGVVLSICEFARGTGIDFWCDDSGALRESHPQRHGLPHGAEQWWGHPRRVFIERHWYDGRLHGIERVWNAITRMNRGYPRFWIDGQRVARPAYVETQRQDHRLPSYRERDNHPKRAFPPRFKRRVRRPLR